MRLQLKKYGSVFFVLMSIIGMPRHVWAQEDAATAHVFLAQAQKAYQEAAYLGFRVKYLYTNAGTGMKPMDSLSGEMQMDKGRCRMVIDGTETVVTGRYMIQVMENDKAMYLSSAVKAIPMNPTQLLDTLLRQMKDVKATLTTEEGVKVLTLRFPPGGTYTSIRMVMDPVTGYFRQITYSVRTAGFVSQDQINSPTHAGSYEQEGQVEMIFRDYVKGRFGDALFDESNFFTHAAGKYEPAGRFRDYHIFLASSNL